MGNLINTWKDMKNWYEETSGEKLVFEDDYSWNDISKAYNEWNKRFKQFCREKGYTEYSGNVYIRDYPGYKIANGINNSTTVSNYGTYGSAPSWSKGSAVSGSITGTLTGGSAKVGQQLLETKVNPTTGKVTTTKVGGTIVGSMGLGDLLLGSALGVGLGVAFTEFFPDQATDFSNFCLLPLINYGIIEPATYEDTRVGIVSVLREHNEEGTGNKLITPYAPYELVEKGLQYLLKIGAFIQVNDIDVSIPNVGSIASFNVLSRNDILTAFADLINGNFFPDWFTLDDANSMIDFCENKGYITYSEDLVTNYTFQGGDVVGFLQRIAPKEKFTGKIVYVDEYDTGKGNGAELKGALSGTSWWASSGCYIRDKSKNINNYGSLNRKSVSTADWLYCGLGTLNNNNWYLGCVNTTFKKGDNKVKGLKFTDYTPLINSINDITAQLEAWKKKNGFKISTPEYDENGNPIREREQWYLPLPTPNPSSKTSPDYTLPTGIYEPTNIPDNDPDLQDEVINRNHDYSQDLPSNPSYNPTPTPPSEDTGEITPSTSILGNNGQGLWSVYNPSLAQINEFGAWLWSNNIWEQIRQYFSDPMQGVIGLHKIYCKPTNGETKTIIAGYLDSGVNSPIVTKQYEKIDCGTMACAEYYGNALDYAPYTTVHLYLPFIGIVPLNVNEVMGSVLHIFYDVDILTGACLATVEVKDSANVNTSLYQYNGICSVQIPLTSGNYGSVISSLVTTGAGIVATVASGGALAPVALGGAVSALNSGTEIKQSGTIGANVGAMARKKPYMVITRKIPHMPLNYNELIGFPSNNRVYLSELSGFVRTKKVYVSSLIATQNEKNMIEEILSDGVYI